MKVDVKDSDPTFQKLKKVHTKRYKKIFEVIKLKTETDEFEFLFILYTLGVFLHTSSMIIILGSLEGMLIILIVKIRNNILL